MFQWHDWSGYIGVGLIVLAYFLLQAAKLHGRGVTYQLMNLFGAVGISLSLLFGTLNLPALLLQVVWILISVYGLAASKNRRSMQGRTDTLQ